MGATQQSVSRWEKGESRPRERELPRLAVVLGIEVRELLDAAGYGAAVEKVTSFDNPFPVHGMTPEGFERFSFFLLNKLYRDPKVQVERAGDSGHAQDGIDISVRGPGWIHLFQCKRVSEFGPKKVATAVAALTAPADTKVLLLSTTASPAARGEASKHAGWQIWDREDISQRVRSLPLQEQRELVHTFFRSRQFELLGELDGSPWQTVDTFFAPFTESSRFFNHNWPLVGRTAEVSELDAAIKDESVLVTMLVGAAGGGKSRLIRHSLAEYERAHPETLVRVLASTDSITAKSLEELGTGPKLLAVDDAHDREDLGLLFHFCALQANHCRVLLALRPYGHEMVRNQAAAIALSGKEVKVVALRPEGIDAHDLAVQALQAINGPVEAAADLAKATKGSALATVLGAKILAREGVHPIWISNDTEFQAHIVSRFQDVITGGIASGQDIARLQGVLRITALVQPIVPDQPDLLSLMEAIEGVQAHDATRLVKTLVDAGVLFRRGTRFRLAPDLLADSIIQRYCLDSPGGKAYVQRVFDKIEEQGQFLRNLLLNLGSLDWRRREGDTSDSDLLSGLWSKLRWGDDYWNPQVEAAAAVAFYQPRQALDFAKRLVHDGHGHNTSVCEMIKNAAHNHAFLGEACMLLWKAGTRPREDPKGDPKGIEVLKELAAFNPNKPPEFAAEVVDFALEAIKTPELRNWAYESFQILEAALATEGHTAWASNSRTITFSAYAVPENEVRDIRAKIVQALFDCLERGTVRMAFQAARAMQSALTLPNGRFGLRIEDDARESWMKVHAHTLNRLASVASESKLPPVVLVRLAESVSWHAFGGSPETMEPAVRILKLLDRDVDTRVTRCLMDGWGSETWPLDEETFERPKYEADFTQIVNELHVAHPDAKSLCAYLEGMLRCLDEAGADTGSRHLLIHRLIRDRPDIAQEVVHLQLQGDPSPLKGFGGFGLGVLLNAQTGESRKCIQKLLHLGTPAAVEMVAEAYVLYEANGGYTPADIEIFRAIFGSKEISVLRVASSLLRTVARANARLAAQLVCIIDFKAAGRWTHEFFAAVANKRDIPEEVLSVDQLERLLASLKSVPDLDDHWVWRFLKVAIRRTPAALIEFVKERLIEAERTSDWRAGRLISRRHTEGGLDLTGIDGWQTYLVDFLDWGLERIGGKTISGFDFGEAIVALCGQWKPPTLAVLLTWMRTGGSRRHVYVASLAIRHLHNAVIYANPDYVQEAVRAAHEIGEESAEEMRSAFYAAAVSGMRSGVPGEPFPADLRQEEHASSTLAKLSRFDPSYELYSALLADARERLARQAKQKEAMDAEDEERE